MEYQQSIFLSAIVLSLINVVLSFTRRRHSSLYCGLVGFSGDCFYDADKLRVLYMYNEKRGDEASGFYMKGTNPLDKRVVKAVGAVSDTMLPTLHMGEGYTMMGHTRHGTTGGNTIENAHPFLIDTNKERLPIVGMHNGIVTNRIDLYDKYNRTLVQLPVDSMIIFDQLQAKEGIEILEELGGDNYAIIYTFDDDTLFVYRRTGRPLFRGLVKYNSGKKGMYISSEKDSLSTIECDSIKEFKTDTLYTIKYGEIVDTRIVVARPYNKPVTQTNYTGNRTTHSRVGSSTIDTTPVINFDKCYWLGHKTAADYLINTVMDDANHSTFLRTLDNLKNEINQIDETMGKETNDDLVEHMTELLYYLKKELETQAQILATSIKSNPIAVGDISSVAEQLINQTGIITDEVTYLQTGDIKSKEAVERKIEYASFAGA